MIEIKKAIVTGPTGAVGVALINELINNDVTVFAFCRKGSKRITNIPKHERVHVLECDMSEYETIEDERLNECDAFFHLAWNGTYGAERNDFYMQQMNIKYTIDAVHLAKKCGCKVFLGTGSQSEFGHIDTIIEPHSPCNPDNGYGIAKLCAGQMSRELCNVLGIKHIWCRIVSLYGPYDAAHTMIMSSVNKMLKGEKTQFTKAEQLWDYIYSKDAARAFRMLAESGKNNEIYCIASGKNMMLKDYILQMRDCINPELEVEIGALPYYEHQVMNLKVDVSALKQDVGFECQYSFADGINDMLLEIRKG